MRKVLALGVLVVVLLGACSRGGNDSADSVSQTGLEDEAGSGEARTSDGASSFEADGSLAAEAPADAGALQLGVSAAAAAQVAPTGRAVIRTAELEVRTGDVPEASDRALTLVEAAGGFLANQRSDLQGRARAVLTFKVPPADFIPVLADLADLGDLITRRVGSYDVTEQVVDVEGRLAAVTASVDRLRALLAQAADVPQVVAVEGELARREGELEALTGQLRALRAQTDLATVTLTLSPPPDRSGQGPEDDDEDDDDIAGFFGGLRTGGNAIVTIADAAATVGGFLLPFVPMALVLALPGRWAWRRWGRPRRPTPVPTAA